jgi:hypothetical protein
MNVVNQPIVKHKLGLLNLASANLVVEVQT